VPRTLDALAAGESDPERLAGRVRTRIRASRAQVVEALRGRLSDHQRLLLRIHLGQADAIDAAIAGIDAELGERLEAYREAAARLTTIPGVSALSAAVSLRRRSSASTPAEVGVDMSRFPSAGHLASWVGICPGNYESAGKRQRGTTRKGNRWLKTMLVECGWGAGRARRTYLGAQYARLSRRRGKKKAAMAVGHSILVAAYCIIRDRVPYRDLGPDHFDHLASQRLTRHYLHRLEQLGHRVTLEPAA
jgi:transposase